MVTADTTSAQRRPDFIIAGFAKCGSTSLYESLQQHPDIWMPSEKEPNFFNFGETGKAAFETYLGLFKDAPAGAMVGEASVMYSQYSKHPETPARVFNSLPDVKLIFIVRHPVEQVISHVHEWMKHEAKAIDLEKTVRSGFFVCCAMYYWQIEAFRMRFNDNQILVVFFEDYMKNTKSVLAHCFRFLDVDPDKIDITEPAWKNNYADSSRPTRLLVAANRLGVADTIRKILPTNLRNFAHLITRKPMPQKGELLPVTRQWLSEELAYDVDRLLAFTGKPANFWSGWPLQEISRS